MGTTARPNDLHRRAAEWAGDTLLGFDDRELARVVPDGRWPQMYRVVLADGRESDVLNRSRARNLALMAALDPTQNPRNKILGARGARAMPRPQPVRMGTLWGFPEGSA